MASLVDRLLPDALWQRIQPLLPAPPPALAVAPRAASQTATASAQSASWPAPQLLGACSRPRNWAAAARPPAGGGWTSGPAPACSTSSRRCRWTNSVRPAGSTWTGSASTPSACGRSRGDLTGANPVDRGKQGCKLHAAGERGGLPLSVVLSAANANDSTTFEAVLDDIPAIRIPTGRRRCRPGKAHGDKPMTIAAAGRISVGVASARGSPAAGSSRRIGLAVTAGRSSAPARGLEAGGGCGFVMSETPNASTLWCCWPAQSSASTHSSGHHGDGAECPLPARSSCSRDGEAPQPPAFSDAL